MPGIIPMKLIKSVSGNQTRVAQACDRCRSKKIRCDGIRPCCTQCEAVGFECKTSDKLSRRAFPRGYTESLEDRVRNLETENRELKELLDAKEEQIDMLSRLHSFSPYSPPASTWSATGSSPKRASSHKTTSEASVPSSTSDDHGGDDIFVVPESTSLIQDSKYGGFFQGASSGRSFVDTFKNKLRNSDLHIADFESDMFFARKEQAQTSRFNNTNRVHDFSTKAPPRMISDLLLTSFFQEYHPLFPVLHRPAFLRLYENLVDLENSSPGYPREHHEIAQLFLVFAIASSQTEARNSPEHEAFECHFQQALDAIIMEPTMETLQCLVLAQLYSMSIGDYAKLVQYKSLAVGIAMRLGLNQSQKKFSLSPLNNEMRKRVFWCVYCLDSFSAAMLGLPKMIQEEDVDCEYPADIDDEYVSDKGFLPTLPGDHTKISSSIALFRISRMLSKVLVNVYSTTLTYRQSYRRLQELEDDLDAWKAALAPHLRLEFVNGVPGTNIVHSRSPLLVLAYHYIRVLIHRPTVGSDIANKTTGSIHAVAESSKCIYQIIKLLEERKLGFSFCLNKNHTLLLCGFAILYSSIDYAEDGALAKESQKLASDIVMALQKGRYPLLKEFRAIAAAVVKIERKDIPAQPKTRAPLPSPPLSVSPGAQPLRQNTIHRAKSVSAHGAHEKRRSVSKRDSLSSMSPPSRAGSTIHKNSSRTSLQSMAETNMCLSPDRTNSSSSSNKVPITPITNDFENLDLFSWTTSTSTSVTPTHKSSIKNNGGGVSNEEWERMLAALDHNHGISIYGGGPEYDTRRDSFTLPPGMEKRKSSASTWSIDSWNVHQALHPTAASVSSFSTLSEEESNALYDLENGLLSGPLDSLAVNGLLGEDWTL